MSEFIQVRGHVDKAAMFKLWSAAQRASQEKGRLLIGIDSGGGLWAPARAAGAEVYRAKATAVVSYAASAAAYIALCCDKVLARPDAEFGFHRVRYPDGMEGDPRVLADDNDHYATCMARKTKLSFARCREIMNQEWNLSGEEAFELGLVDQLFRD